MTRDEALGSLRALRSMPRKPGWDRKLQQRVIDILVEYSFGKLPTGDGTLKFLEAAIQQFEVEDMIDKKLNRREGHEVA